MPTTIINASAGSGKTYRLAVAYLQALLLPLPDGGPTLPQQVLATTFTRAAASEILERVLRRLALAVVSDEERQRLLAEIKRPELGRDDLATLLASVCQALPQLQVGTIDALFARMVRVMGLDLAFPPAWTVADETQAEELAHKAADRILRGSDVQLSLGQWRRYAQFKPGIRVRAALVDLLEDNRFLLLDASGPADNPDLAQPRRLDPQDALQVTQALEAFAIPLTKGKKPEANKSWVKAIDQIKALLQGEPSLVSILTGHSMLRLMDEPEATYSKVPLPASLREILGPLVRQACADLRRLHEARLPALTALARSYHEFRRLVAYAGAAYRFPEVEAAARTLPPHLSPDDLYFRLDGQVQHLLLDEFQDTSLSQFRFLWPLIEEVRANGRLFFAVGDVKQSIYGWRGADRHLLNQLPDWLDPQHQDKNLTRETLDDNRRSSPAVLKAIDRLFERLDQFACLDPATYKDKGDQDRARVRRSAAASFISGYRPHIPAGDNRHLAGRVRLLTTQPADAEADADAGEAYGEIETILGSVEHHRQEDANREIAILCRRRKWIPSIIAGLRLRGIEASGEGGSAVADSAAVELVLSMLTWLDHPGHSLARGHVELSGGATVFGLTGSQQDQALPKRMQTEIMRRDLAAVIADWVRQEPFRRRCTVHDQVRCEQLVELARHWDAAGGGRLSRFVERVRSQRLDNPISSRVRVMTIHGCKGLEFEAVILADLQSGGGGGDGPRFVVSMTTPDAVPEIHLLPSRDEAELLGLHDLYERHQQNQFEEDLSVLYVALTRAKSFLDVVAPASDKAKASLVGILSEGWGHHEAGTHLIEQCEPDVQPVAHAQSHVMARDAGIWGMGSDLRIPRFQAVPNRLSAVTPSGQQGAGVVKLALVLNTGNKQALERGTAVHALFSRIEWNDKLPSLENWIHSIPGREADPEACRVAARELYPRLRDSRDILGGVFDPAPWLDLWKEDGVVRLEVWRERRFAVALNLELMNGSFDRVVFGLDANGARVRARILDFKTDRVANDAEREELRQFYQPQLDAYIGALRKLTALPAAFIEAELVWINR
jgi:ATP-dependent helicase/nuclease subunit A